MTERCHGRVRRSLLDDLRGAHVANAEQRQHDVLRADVVVPQLARLLQPKQATPCLRAQCLYVSALVATSIPCYGLP